MKILFMDTETGGTNPQVHSLLSVGLVAYDSTTREINESMEILINHEEYVVQAKALEVNGINLITHDATGYLLEPSWKAVRNFIDRNFDEPPTIAGHNVWFDKEFMYQAFKTIGKDFKSLIHHRSIDTLSLLQTLYAMEWINKKASSSTGGFEYFGVEVIGRHTALGDAKACIKLFEAITDMIKGRVENDEL